MTAEETTNKVVRATCSYQQGDLVKQARTFLVPGIQILAAAVGLVAWLLLGSISPQAYQAFPIEIFAIAAVLALPLTLGLPYLLPNFFRNVDITAWRGKGPWSAVITVGVSVATCAAVIGLGVTFMGAYFSLGRSVAITGTSLSAASLVASSILTAQTARLLDSVPRMLLSTVGNLAIPVFWLALAPFKFSLGEMTLAFGFLTLCCVGAQSFCERSRLVSFGAVCRSLAPKTVQSALLLVPHLLLFSTMIQGVRLASTVLGSPSLVDAHNLMLLVSIGATLVAALHSLLTVRIQSANDKDLANRTRRNALLYAVMGVLGGVLLFSAVRVLGEIVPTFPSLNTAEAAAFSTVLPSLVAYYAVSGLILRENATHLLLISSATAVAVMYGPLLLLGDASLSTSLVIYALAAAILPSVSLLLGCILLPALRNALLRTSAVTATGYAPSVIALVLLRLFGGSG